MSYDFAPMEMHIRRAAFVSLFVLGVSAARVTPAFAAAIVFNSGFTANPAQNVAITPFNPALGTLQSVGVSIVGTLTMEGIVTPVPDGLGGFLPTPYIVRADQSFDGPLSTFFEFTTPAAFQFAGNAVVPGSLELISPFTYGFTFTATSDLVGFDIPSFTGATTPPVTVAGTRNGFLSSALGNQVLLTHQANLISGPVSGLTARSQGTLTVTYNYDVPAAPVPEPASIVLLGSGLIVSLARRVRRHY